MIIFIKRSSAVLLVCIFGLTLLLGVVSGARAQKKQTQTQRLIMVDAGHGEPDGGCCGDDGTKEAELNLAVSLKLKSVLESRGYRVILTRTDASGIHDSGKTAGEKKRSDMRNRKKLRDASGAALFVSIHMNTFSQKRYHGAQVIYDTANPSAQQAAICIQDMLKTELDPANNRVAMASPETIYLMRSPKIPSLIVECGFLSNDEELAKLKTQDYQAALAEAIAKGIDLFDKKTATNEEIKGMTTKLKR